MASSLESESNNILSPVNDSAGVTNAPGLHELLDVGSILIAHKEAYSALFQLTAVQTDVETVNPALFAKIQEALNNLNAVWQLRLRAIQRSIADGILSWGRERTPSTGTNYTLAFSDDQGIRVNIDERKENVARVRIHNLEGTVESDLRLRESCAWYTQTGETFIARWIDGHQLVASNLDVSTTLIRGNFPPNSAAKQDSLWVVGKEGRYPLKAYKRGIRVPNIVGSFTINATRDSAFNESPNLPYSTEF